jgi:hypothetical protein
MKALWLCTVVATTALAAGEVSTGSRGFGFTSEDGADSLLFHLLVQPEYAGFVGSVPAGLDAHRFELGFAGVQLDATLRERFHSLVLVSFALNRVTLTDAFVEAKVTSALTIRVGKFPTPISEERVTPRILLPWASTSPASFLTPARVAGVEALGEVWARRFQYELALVAAGPGGSNAEFGPVATRELFARGFLHPFRDTSWAALTELGVGVGGSVGRRDGSLAQPATLRLASYGGATFFAFRADGTAPGTAVASGLVARVAPHVAWSFGPVAAFADFVHEVDAVGSRRVQSDAASGTVTVSLTGDVTHAFRRSDVSSPVGRGGFGSLQLVGGGGWVHVATEAFDGLADPNVAMPTAFVLGVGLNWYPIEGIGLIADYSHTAFNALTGHPNRAAEDVITAVVELRL